MLDGKGRDFADVFEPGNRRVWVSLADVPDFVQKAFVAAEDRRFFPHHGVDERGIIRAFIGNLASPGRPQGGSTITQQVVKNLLVGEDVTYERKIREMIVASRLESTMSKEEILELYLNSAYLGRGSWGVEMAAHSYFGKSVKDLTVGRRRDARRSAQGAELFQSRPSSRSRQGTSRLMSSAACRRTASSPPGRRTRRLQRRQSSSLSSGRTATAASSSSISSAAKRRSDGVPNLTAQPYTVHSTINANLAARSRSGAAGRPRALRDRQRAACSTAVRRPISPTRCRSSAPARPGGTGQAWQQALQAVRLPLYDVHWDARGGARQGRQARRRRHPRRPRRRPRACRSTPRRRRSGARLNVYDVVYVRVIEARPATRTKPAATAPGKPPAAAGSIRRRSPGAIARAADRAGRGAGAGEQDRPHPRNGRGLFLPAEPAQSDRADAAPARLGDQAADLSHRAAEGLAAEHARSRRSDHAAADRQSRYGRDIISREASGGYREQDYWTPRNADYGSGGVYHAAARA